MKNTFCLIERAGVTPTKTSSFWITATAVQTYQVFTKCKVNCDLKSEVYFFKFSSNFRHFVARVKWRTNFARSDIAS